MTTGGHDSGSGPEDELLVRVFQQVTDRQTARYAATYDMNAGLARFRDWLHEHTAPPVASPGPSVASQVPPVASQVPLAVSQRDTGRPASVTQSISAGSIVIAIKAGGDAIEVPFRPLPAKLAQTADQAVADLYSTCYRSLVRLAALLVRDEPTAEEVVQECFIAMHDGWHRLRDEEKALSYLKQAVMNRSRSVVRHRGVMDRDAPVPAPDRPSGEQEVISLPERSAVIRALRGLPDRQRQALVLRYYAEMPEAQIAEMMGISKGAVKSHTARGMASLRAVLEQTS